MSVKIRTRKTKDNRESIYLDINYPGKRRICKSLNLYISANGKDKRDKMKLAEMARAETEHQLNTGTYDPMHNSKSTKVFDYIDKLDKKRPKTGYKYLKRHLEIFTKNPDLRFFDINKKFIDEFVNYLLNEVSKSSANSFKTRLGAVLMAAVKDDIITASPMIKVDPIKTEHKERVYLTIDEIELILNAHVRGETTKYAFLFGCFTGLRFSDIKKLTWGEIDYQNNMIHFRHQKTRDIQHLPLSQTAIDILEKHKPAVIKPLPQLKVFSLSSYAAVAKSIKVLAKTAGIDKDITFHTSRHTFAGLALANGADIYTLANLLNHKDLKTTQLYAKVIDERLNEAVKAIPVINIS